MFRIRSQKVFVHEYALCFSVINYLPIEPSLTLKFVISTPKTKLNFDLKKNQVEITNGSILQYVSVTKKYWSSVDITENWTTNELMLIRK